MLVLYGFYESFKRWKCSGEENDYKMPDWEKKEEETNCGVKVGSTFIGFLYSSTATSNCIHCLSRAEAPRQ